MEMFWYQTEAMIQNDVLDSHVANVGTLPPKEAERYQHYVEYEDGFASYSDYLKRKDKKR